MQALGQVPRSLSDRRARDIERLRADLSWALDMEENAHADGDMVGARHWRNVATRLANLLRATREDLVA